MTKCPITAAIVMLCLMAFAHPAMAHGLLMKLRGEGRAINGELYYSNGKAAGGEWVEITDLTAVNGPINVQTSPKGAFTAQGMPGHRYQVKASAEENHQIVMELVLEGEARGRMVETDPQAAAEQDAAKGGVPAWAMIGGILLLSTIPAALWRRSRSSASGDGKTGEL
jgi:hypothetical protein